VSSEHHRESLHAATVNNFQAFQPLGDETALRIGPLGRGTGKLTISV